MTFREWILSDYTRNPSVSGQWGALHIATLAACIALIIAIAFFGRRRPRYSRENIIIFLTACIFVLEIARRVVNIVKGVSDFDHFLYIMLPRPWCAISCWLLITSVLVRKAFFRSFAAMNALLCALIFFFWPVVGFNNEYILFENFYSISTHALLLVTSVSLITLGLCDFRYSRDGKWPLPELIMLVCTFAYGFAEVFLIKCEADPLYFMPDGEVQSFLGFSYSIYLVLYIAFLIFYFNIFYIVGQLVHNKRRAI